MHVLLAVGMGLVPAIRTERRVLACVTPRLRGGIVAALALDLKHPALLGHWAAVIALESMQVQRLCPGASASDNVDEEVASRSHVQPSMHLLAKLCACDAPVHEPSPRRLKAYGSIVSPGRVACKLRAGPCLHTSQSTRTSGSRDGAASPGGQHSSGALQLGTAMRLECSVETSMA